MRVISDISIIDKSERSYLLKYLIMMSGKSDYRKRENF